jgi:glutaminase
VIADACTERVLSVMSTCGMYDAAGEWVAEVGMAAKSGVGGGILAVLPGQLSIAVFSPRLDSHGNSVRGVKACRRLSNELELHALHVARSAHSAVRDSYDIVEAPSALQRPVEDRRILDEHGRRARIFELHGDLLFAGAESVMRAIEAEGDGLEYLVLDVRQVDDVANITRRLLGGLRAALSEAGCQGMVVDPGGLLPGARWSSNGNSASHVFESLADATMWCEDQLLERYGAGARPTADRFKYAEHPLLSTVSEHTRKALRERMATRTYAGGDVIVAEGDPDASMFLILAGRVRSSLTTVAGLTRPLATLTPGTCFGDVYLATGTPHLTSMHADGPVECLELTREEFARINAEDSELRAALLWVFLASAHDDMDRSLRALANGRVTPMTSS